MAKKKKSSKDYFGLDYIVSLILAIIPVTAWIFGAITRLKEGQIVAFIVRLIGGFTVVWILDLICMILKKRICRFLFII